MVFKEIEEQGIDELVIYLNKAKAEIPAQYYPRPKGRGNYKLKLSPQFELPRPLGRGCIYKPSWALA